MTCWSW